MILRQVAGAFKAGVCAWLYVEILNPSRHHRSGQAGAQRCCAPDYMRNAKCVTARGLTAEEQVQGYFAFCAFGGGDGLETEIVEAIDAREVGGESLEDDGGFDAGFFPVGWRVFEGQGFGAGQSFRAACEGEWFESFDIHFHERPGFHG
jgi:hypothetical protein